MIVICPVHLIDPSYQDQLNAYEIVREEPRLVSTVPHGKCFVVGHDYDQINIVHVYGGTPYDMGFALGKLMSKEMNELIPEYFDYLDKQIENILKIVPPVSIYSLH